MYAKMRKGERRWREDSVDICLPVREQKRERVSESYKEREKRGSVTVRKESGTVRACERDIQ